MADRYRGYAPSGRSATYNPARASLPSSIGYSSLYAGDMHVMPASASSRHPTATPRGYTTAATPAGVPTTTRTYGVAPDPRARLPAHDIGRSRRSTLDSNSRPPVIITTTQKDRPQAGSSHSSNPRSGSPSREDYRSSEGQFYTQPASSVRSRSHTRPHITVDPDDYSRSRDRPDALLTPREAEAYRNSRPTVVYPSDPRHSNAAIDYGDEEFSYTNAGELARYDLDHPQTSRSRRRESFDRGYYRPNINYNADQRSLAINPSPDLSRNYNMNTSRPYEGRGGPPPTTRGFDKIRPGYDGPRDVPPAAPVAPTPTAAAQPDLAAGGRRSRPVSLYQDAIPRSAHHDDYYRTREDERTMRELRDRDRESERTHDASHFHDSAITSRGFGIRTEALDDFDDRRDRLRESRREQPLKRSDEDLARPSDTERDDPRRSRDVSVRQDARDERRERRESKRGSDDEKERSRFRDKIASGLGIVGTAVGLSAVTKDDDKRDKDKDDKEPRRRRSPEEDRERRRDSDEAERPRARDKEREREVERVRDDSRGETEARERNRRDAEAKLSGEAVVSASDSDDAKRGSRRQHRSSKAGFDPNDTNDLLQLKEQLAAVDISDKGKGKEREREVPAIEDRVRTRSPSPTKGSRVVDAPRDDSRGRELSVAPAATRQVRVVSPPRDKSNDKPVRGILKQPKVSFPEETNPVREGVAPHKEDKKLKEVPPGARWTKISRKIVNPEALTVGKERFEVRDDFVIVLRVLNSEEIQAYAAATQVLRERRRNGEDKDGGRGRTDRDRDRRDQDRDDDRDRDRDRERDRRDRDHDRDEDRDRDHDRDADDDSGRRRHRHHHHRDEEEADASGDRERRRRHRRDDEDDYEPRGKDLQDPHGHHHRSFRERERDRDRPAVLTDRT